jgi:hypothetical protein
LPERTKTPPTAYLIKAIERLKPFPRLLKIVETLQFQKKPLHRDAGAETAQTPVGSRHTVAWDEKGKGVCVKGPSDRPGGLGMTAFSGHPGVRTGLTAGNAGSGFQDRALKTRQSA